MLRDARRPRVDALCPVQELGGRWRRGQVDRGLLHRCLLCAIAARGAALPVGCQAGLLHGRQALELGTGEVLLLQRGRLQHQVLLLRGVHLLQVLCRCVGLPVQGLLDHLDGLAVGNATVDGDLRCGWARGAGAAGRRAGAAGAAGAVGGERAFFKAVAASPAAWWWWLRVLRAWNPRMWRSSAVDSLVAAGPWCLLLEASK